MHYTTDKDSKIDAKVENDQSYINSHVLDLLENHVHSILLCGGFGRGEGSVDVRNDEIHIVNDYDITIVLKERNRFKYALLYHKYYARLQSLASDLANRLQMKQIDLALKHWSYFEKATVLKIENYEVKEGHVLTYGEKDPTRLMPDWKAESIPLFEGTWMFRNRGAGMLIPALYFMLNDDIPEEKKENFIIECNKAQLAIGDSILLLKSRYHHLYSERLRRIECLDVLDIPEGENLLEHYREALEQKLKPDFEKFYQRDLKEWWFDIVRILDIFYRYFEKKRLRRGFKNWIGYVGLHAPEDQLEIKGFMTNMIRMPYAFLSKRELRMNYLKARKTFTIRLLPLILFSLLERGFYFPYMAKAAELLCMSLNGEERDDWIYLAKTYLRLWHSGGEVANVINF